MATVVYGEETNFFMDFLLFFPYFVNGMLYNQATLYGHVIADRCIALNDFVKTINLNESRDENISIFPRIHKNVKVKIVKRTVMEIKELHQALVELSETYFNLFRWSILFNFANDFQAALSNVYWLMLFFIVEFETDYVYYIAVGPIISFLNIAVILNTCNRINDEIRRFPCHLQAVDLESRNFTLQPMVSKKFF